MKIIGLFLITILLATGCSNKMAEVTTEYEASQAIEEAVLEEAVTEITNGSMYTYSYFYTTGGVKTKVKLFIVKMDKGIKNTELEAYADNLKLNDHEYAVLDYRHASDADIQVRNSYKATTEKERQCVIDMLLAYEESYPSKWERSVASMKNEWYWHNSAYEAGYSAERAKHVDFNNKDEKNYPTLNPLKNE